MSFASAAHICAMLDLIRQGTIDGDGLKRVEAVPFAAIKSNRFLSHVLGSERSDVARGECFHLH